MDVEADVDGWVIKRHEGEYKPNQQFMMFLLSSDIQQLLYHCYKCNHDNKACLILKKYRF